MWKALVLPSYSKRNVDFVTFRVHCYSWTLSLARILLINHLIQWDTAYSIFPDATFSHKTYQLKPMEEFHGPLLAKYSARGYTTHSVIWPEDERYINSLPSSVGVVDHAKLSRHIGDSLSWNLPLDTTDITPGIPAYLMAQNFFHIYRHLNSPLEPHYYLVATPFQSAVLRYQYMYPDSESAFWMTFLGPRVEDLTKIELLKVPEERRPIMMSPEAYWKDAELVRDNPPAGWRFWDEEIPHWWEAFRQFPPRKLRKLNP